MGSVSLAVQDMVGGRVIPPGDLSALRQALIQCLRETTWGPQAKAYVREHFSLTRMEHSVAQTLAHF
jgi:hypothetical protein